MQSTSEKNKYEQKTVKKNPTDEVYNQNKSLVHTLRLRLYGVYGST